MYLWLIPVILLGGLICTALIIDLVSKRKGYHVDFEKGANDASDPDKVYAEINARQMTNDIDLS
ncbi:MAG TPA: hypothetical protein VFK44_11055 [Bacillales bacterium]|nr:hypothetical protein [Bacillales bacterium]